MIPGFVPKLFHIQHFPVLITMHSLSMHDKFIAESGLSSGLVLRTTQPCFNIYRSPFEGTLDHEIYSLSVRFQDVVPENRNPWLLKEEMEMDSFCRHSATELEPDYICFPLVNNGDQPLGKGAGGGGRKKGQKPGQSLEKRHTLVKTLLWVCDLCL